MSDPGLFPLPEAATAPVSKRGLRGPLGKRVVRVTWAPVKLRKPISCEECFELQHETGGAYGPRADARQRRTAHTAGGDRHVMALCTRHAQAWHEKDVESGLEKQG